MQACEILKLWTPRASAKDPRVQVEAMEFLKLPAVPRGQVEAMEDIMMEVMVEAMVEDMEGHQVHHIAPRRLVQAGGHEPPGPSITPQRTSTSSTSRSSEVELLIVFRVF